MFETFDDAVVAIETLISKDIKDPEAFFAAEPIFREILDRRLYLDKLNAVLRSVFDRTTPTNGLLTPGTLITLHNSETSSWIVMEQGRNSKHLYMTPVHTFQSPISGSGYAVDRYRLISQGSLDEVDSNATLEFISNEWISPFCQ